MAWQIQPTADYEKAKKEFAKRWPAELRAVAANLATVLRAVEAGAKSEQLKNFGFIHSEPRGILAITERGCDKKTKPKATRLYIFVDDVDCVIYVMLLGDKRDQSRDIHLCEEYVKNKFPATNAQPTQ